MSNNLAKPLYWNQYISILVKKKKHEVTFKYIELQSFLSEMYLSTSNRTELKTHT